MAKPITDLFAESQPVTPQQPTGSNPIASAAVLVLCIVLAFFAWQKYGPTPGPNPQPKPDDQEQVEPQPQPKIVGKTLIFIHERDPQPIEHDLLLREMPEFTAAHKMQFRAFDDDLDDAPVPALKAYAKLKGIDPPFVVMTGPDDKPARVMKWPTNKNGLEELFK